METISFDQTIKYNTLQAGITVLVVLQYGGKDVDFEAKVDTGATHCIFERRHAERLGIDVESGELETFNTVMGSFAGYRHEVTLLVLEIESVCAVYFAQELSFTRNILGRQGWLDRVKLGLIDYEGKLLLSAYGK